jgi:hypothetical protein
MKNITRVEKIEITSGANTMFALGWVLVTTHTRLFGAAGFEKLGDEYVCFIVGWPDKTPPVTRSILSQFRKALTFGPRCAGIRSFTDSADRVIDT